MEIKVIEITNGAKSNLPMWCSGDDVTAENIKQKSYFQEVKSNLLSGCLEVIKHLYIAQHPIPQFCSLALPFLKPDKNKGDLTIFSQTSLCQYELFALTFELLQFIQFIFSIFAFLTVVVLEILVSENNELIKNSLYSIFKTIDSGRLEA